MNLDGVDVEKVFEYNKVLVIGNGVSRKQFALSNLSKSIFTIGCNALYRDYTPDILISVDEEISKEIQLSGYAKNNKHYTRKPISGLGSLTIDTCYGYSSGPIAIAYAVKLGFKDIFMMGFDFEGIGGKINNVYSGTPGYKPAESKSTYYGNWANQLSTIINSNTERTFIRVTTKEFCFVPEELKFLKNLHHIDMAEFLTKYNI